MRVVAGYRLCQENVDNHQMNRRLPLLGQILHRKSKQLNQTKRAYARRPGEGVMLLIIRIVEIWVASNFAFAVFLLYRRSPQFRDLLFRHWIGVIFTPNTGRLASHAGGRRRYSMDDCAPAAMDGAKGHILNLR
jgi:hypothetical protein